MTTITIPVIFRIDEDGNTGEVLAIYPEEPSHDPHRLMEYTGNQSGSGSICFNFFYKSTRPAKFAEYKDYLQQLARSENHYHDDEYIVFDVKERVTYEMNQKRIKASRL